MLQNIKNVILQKARKQKRIVAFAITGLWRRYQRFIYQNWITITTSLVSIGLCSAILYMLVSPLPKLPEPNFGNEQPITSETSWVRSIASLDNYTELLKTRDLFKPSIPIPAEKKIVKTTAQQLAERLKFLGTSGDMQNLSALVFIPERGPGSFQVGDRVAEFVLKDVRKDSLVLELEDEQIVLKR